MKAKLVKQEDRVGGGCRIYELSEPITKGKSDIIGPVDINEEVNKYVKNWIKPEYKEKVLEKYDNKCVYIVVSDAITHIERLVFPVVRYEEDKYVLISSEIAGKHTMMIHGGDPDSVYDDEVYLRWLAKLNGLKWEGYETA